MRPIDLEEQKQIQLNILIKVDQFCRENNLRYSLGGGTLLGAVRHKGFIPWDDDIDIMMPRPDYDKFVRSFNGYDEDLTCEAYELNKKHRYICGKVYNNKTVQEEPNAIKNIGIFIDIFPIDGFPSNESHRKTFLRKVFLWEGIFCLKQSKHNGSLKKICIKLILSIIPASYINNKLNKLLTKYPFSTTPYSGAVCGSYREKECYKSDLFTQYTELEFEKQKFMSIQDYHSYLIQHYGDYMKLPPENKRIPFHTVKSYWI